MDRAKELLYWYMRQALDGEEHHVDEDTQAEVEDIIDEIQRYIDDQNILLASRILRLEQEVARMKAFAINMH
jgi:hypothetical protein